MDIIELARKMTDVNLHTEGVCLLAALSKDQELIRRAFCVRFRHFDEGSMSFEMCDEREEVAKQSWVLIRDVYTKEFCDALWEAF